MAGLSHASAAGVFAILLISMPLKADTLEARARTGVEAFEAGRYEEAVRVFQDLRQRYRIESPDILVNLGAAEFMAGRPGVALLRFHEAVRAAPGSRAADVARLNAERVRTALNERRAEGGTGFVFSPYHDAWSALFGWQAPRETLLAFLCFWSVLFLSLALQRLTKTRARSIMTGVAAFALTGTILAGVSAYGAARVASYEIGVVIGDRAPLYERADSIEPRLLLPEALEARVLERRGALVRVRLSSGQEGWIPERSLGVPDVTSP